MPKRPAARKQPIGQLTTAQLSEMKVLASHGPPGDLWTLRFQGSGVRIWLCDATGMCCMDVRDNSASRWERKTEWFGGEPEKSA